jgi:nuclear GTP-binding protein
VWQYITLFRKIFLIDCPGVVTPSPNETEEDIVLKGVLRIENLDCPEQYIPAVFRRTKKEYLEKTYGVTDYKDEIDFLEKYAVKSGRLLKKAEPDVSTVAKMILNDWLRGKLPYFVPPPETPLAEEPIKRQKPELIAAPEQKISSIRVREEYQDGTKITEPEDDDIVEGWESEEANDEESNNEEVNNEEIEEEHEIEQDNEEIQDNEVNYEEIEEEQEIEDEEEPEELNFELLVGASTD